MTEVSVRLRVLMASVSTILRVACLLSRRSQLCG